MVGCNGIFPYSKTIHCLLDIRALRILGAVGMQKVEVIVFKLLYYMAFQRLNAVSTQSLL